MKSLSPLFCVFAVLFNLNSAVAKDKLPMICEVELLKNYRSIINDKVKGNLLYNHDSVKKFTFDFRELAAKVDQKFSLLKDLDQKSLIEKVNDDKRINLFPDQIKLIKNFTLKNKALMPIYMLDNWGSSVALTKNHTFSLKKSKVNVEVTEPLPYTHEIPVDGITLNGESDRQVLALPFYLPSTGAPMYAISGKRIYRPEFLIIVVNLKKPYVVRGIEDQEDRTMSYKFFVQLDNSVEGQTVAAITVPLAVYLGAAQARQSAHPECWHEDTGLHDYYESFLKYSTGDNFNFLESLNHPPKAWNVDLSDEEYEKLINE